MRMLFATLFAVMILSSQAFADEPVRAKVKIPVPQSGLQQTVFDYELDIERGGPDFIFGYLTEQDRLILDGAGIDYEIIYDDYRQETAWVLSLFDLGVYHSHEEVMFFLDSVATAYPNICRLDSLGESLEGRAIVGIRISDNPQLEEDEPEVRIMGAHHGDERISVEVPIYLIDYLVSNYNSNERVANLIDNTEIFIIPMVNPDGVEHNRRYNSRSQDVNRDYLCPEGDDCPANANYQRSFSEPETRAIRSDALVNRYVLSLSMHAGATNINTVWNYDDGLHVNGDYHETPDDSLIMDLSYGYYERNTTPGFYVTNGCDWYSTHGDANDFSYGYLSDIDWTIELSQTKTPPQNQIESYWEANREAMLYIIENADIGIRGIVTDSDTGLPLDATIVVEEGGKPVFTDPAVGDYHRPLLPGTYHIRAASPGYVSAVSGPIEVTPGPAQALDFQLQPAEMATFNVAVLDSLTGEHLPATVQINSGNFDTLFYYDGTPASITLDSDVYDVRVFSRGYLPEVERILITGSLDRNFQLLEYSADLFSDDFENGLGNWTPGGYQSRWDIASGGFMSDHSLEDSPGDYYANNRSNIRISSDFDLSDFESAGFYFMERHFFQPNYDFLFVDVSIDGGSNWIVLPDTLTGYADDAWRDHFISLDNYCGPGFENIAIRLRMFTGPYVNFDGAYIDDFYLGGYSTSSGTDDLALRPEKMELSQNYPNPFNSSTIIRLSGANDDNSITIEIYDILGRMVNSLGPAEAGGNVYIWNGKDDSGNPVASGVYFYKASGLDHIHTMTLMK